MESQKNKRSSASYATYSSLGIQMVIIILAGAFGGRELDEIVNWKFPVFTVGLTILALILAMIYFMAEIFKRNK
ncbi:MAG: AtpZ/AtpI family protein [Bacteroidales bacterium]|nr:AtpZ/AtpI family protein [Bacteroidales bacterium]